MPNSDADSRIAITICTYNERENIRTLLPAIRSALPAADILVVDDNSPDGTAAEVQEFAANDAHVHLLLRKEKAGLGAATLAGFQWVMQRDYDFLINMDADWSHPPSVLPALLDLMSTADVAIASRYMPGGGVQNWGPHRYVMSWGVNFYSRALLGLSTRDCSGAFRCYRVSKLREIDFTRFRSRGYAFQEEILYRCRAVGCRFRETPFVFADRAVGQSKINVREVIRALRDIAGLGLDRLRGMPVAMKTPSTAESVGPN
ncbi:MAG TPA: polyprenol monophosphomannose synthase [Planctomycetaceae bacterium]|nr:polyprenol monophosphomannose synthase [Planctomycetaceae bacterium]